jgi:glyceraldehyde-3-phosphate dehydrogenase (NADP+)
LKNIFANNNIPENYKIKQPYHQDTYLVNGELKQWTGNTSSVFSPIYTANSEGKLQPTFLGNIPDLGENEALEALNAAVHGQQ